MNLRLESFHSNLHSRSRLSHASIFLHPQSDRHRGIVKNLRRMKRDESSAYIWESAMRFPRNADFNINCQTLFHFDSFLWPFHPSPLCPPPPFTFGCRRKLSPFVHVVFPDASLFLIGWKNASFPFPRLQCTLYGRIFFWKDLPHGSRNRWASLKTAFPLPPSPSPAPTTTTITTTTTLRRVLDPSSRHTLL